MTTIRDELKKSLNVVHGINGIPLTFPYFVMGLASIITYVSWMLTEKDLPDITIDGKTIKGKGAKEVNLNHLIFVMNGNDFLRHTELNLMINGFLKWFLSLPVERDEEGMLLLCEHNYIVSKWNEYQDLRMKGGESDDV